MDLEKQNLSKLTIKDLVILNLNLTEISPARFYRLDSNEFIEVKSQSNFEKILKNMNSIIFTDQDESENS